MQHRRNALRAPSRAARTLRPRRWRQLGAAFAVAIATMTLTACPEEKGPAEKAGEAIDDAADKAKDAVTPDGPAENLGEKLDDATK